ncbi:hypothetical protein [Aureimonas sp. SK2]|uniref:hypothetical protein n=1 Tax=Aureimonas sp. SK2 TaxID=3015992 RepID=UPI002444F79E|nr:hypothetical protein [Aureimonas sp. SK2]
MSAISISPATSKSITISPNGATPIPVQLVAGVPGPRGPGATGDGVTFYDHVQATPTTVWTIAHNLGFRPSVTILSTGGAEMRADVRHLSDDVLTVVFLLPTAGSAHLV